MRCRFTQHARDEMAKRGVGASEVDAVLQAPDQIVAGDAGLNVYQSKIRGGLLLLRVATNDAIDPSVVVAVYLTNPDYS